MRNLKKKLTLRSGKQLIAWEFSCTYRPENKVILHFQSFKRLINSVLFPMTITLNQVNFVLEKNYWNNAQNKKQEVNLLFPHPSACCFDSSRNNFQQFVSITDFVYDQQRNAFQDKHICNSLLFKLRRNSHWRTTRNPQIPTWNWSIIIWF